MFVVLTAWDQSKIMNVNSNYAIHPDCVNGIYFCTSRDQAHKLFNLYQDLIAEARALLGIIH